MAAETRMTQFKRKDGSDLKTEEQLQNAAQIHANMIYRIAVNQLHSVTDAEDIVQEVLLRYYQSGIEFDAVEHEKAWIIRVTINCCKNVYRSSWWKNVLVTDEVHELSVVSGQEEKSDMKFDVLDAVSRLPFKFRVIVYLHYYEGFSVQEISEALHKNKNTVLSHLHRARKLLKRDLT